MAIISIKLDAQDDASKTLERVKKRLGDLTDGPGDFVPSFDVSNLPGSLRQISTLQGAIGSIESMGAVGALAAIGMQAGQLAWDMGKAGSQTLRTRDSFEDLAQSAGISGQAMLRAMRTASAGTVADSELMAAANRALVLEVADSADEMAKLTAAAITRGRQVGVGATQAVNDLVTGIGRMSPEILDNLGIANAKGAFDAYAATLGTTADKLTDVQKKQALVNAVLASAPGATVAEDAAASFERMDAAIQNAKEALGVMFAPAVSAIAQSLADTVTAATDAMTTDSTEVAQNNLFEFGKEVSALFTKYQDLDALVKATELGGDTQKLAAAKQDLAETSSLLGFYAQKYNEAAQIAGVPLIDVAAIQHGELATMAAADATQQLADATGVATAAAAGSELVMEGVRAKLAELAGQAAATGSALRSAWIGAAGALGAAQAFAGFQTAQKQLEGLRQEWNYMGLTSEQIAFKEAEFLDGNNDKIQGQVKLIEDATKAQSAYGSSVGKTASAYDDLASSVGSAVSGLLQQSLALDVAWPGKDKGAGGDAINENAKRLAAIANEGLINQPWLDEFAQEAPQTYADLMKKIAEGADARGAAQQMMAEFQAGLRPDLLDFGMLKDQVKQQILGQQALAGMSDQLTKEIVAEMGVSAQQAQQAIAGVVGNMPGGQALAQDLGGTDLTGAGSSAGGSFAAGFAASANGAAIAVTITAQMAAKLSLFEENGKTSGTKWSAGFYASVESGLAPELLALLVTLVTPGVLAQIQVGASQTGTTDGGQ